MLSEPEFVLIARELKARTGAVLTRDMTGAAEIKLQPLARREGFGGVSEYGITVRWDKNFLTLIYLTLARRESFRVYGGVRYPNPTHASEARMRAEGRPYNSGSSGKPRDSFSEQLRQATQDEAAETVLTAPERLAMFEIAANPGAPVDLFVEPVGGVQLPVPAKAGDAAGVRRFRIDLKGVDDVAKLAGMTLRLTVKDASGAWEIAWPVKG